MILSLSQTSKNSDNASSFRNNIGSPGEMFPGDSMFMQNSMNMGMSSPVVARNAFQMGGMVGFSPTIPLSPGIGMSPAMSVGMMMTPDMQLSAQQTQMEHLTNQMNNNNMSMSQAIPPPPMSSTDNTPQQRTHKMTPQEQMVNRQQQMQLQLQQEKMMMQQRQMMMMMNSGGMGGGGGGGMPGNMNIMGGGDMMSPRMQTMMNNNNNPMMMNSNNPMMNARQQQQLQQMRNANTMGPSQFHQMSQQELQMKPQHVMSNGRINEKEQQQLTQQQLRQLKEEQNAFDKMQQQLLQQQQQQQQTPNEMRMLQSRVAAIYSNNDSLEPRLLPPDNVSSSTQNQISGVSNADSQREAPNRSGSGSGRGIRGVDDGNDQPSSRAEVLPGNNPRRMPPPSLLKRENSLKMEKVFEPIAPEAGGEKKSTKYGGNHSSAHLSAMSLSMGDLNDEGNLSQVFDSSLRITTSTSMGNNKDSTVHQSNKSSRSSHLMGSTSKTGRSRGDDTTRSDRTALSGGGFDMSVATIGMSDAGNMSFATFGDDQEGQDNPDGNMSFSKMFDESATK